MSPPSTRLCSAFLGATLTLLASCAPGPVPSTYTEAEIRAECERQMGWWRPDDLRGGFCEYDSRE